MSHIHTMSTQTDTQTESSTSPYPRENYWGSLHQSQDDEDDLGGHSETQGTDPAQYLAYRQLAQLVDPVCGRSLRLHDREVPLSEPCLYLPKQHAKELPSLDDDSTVIYLEYRQHRHRRRVNEETGWINWGEGTSTAIPEHIDEDVWMLAVHNYLANRGVLYSNVEDWLAYARRLYTHPDMDAVESLAKLIGKKRAFDDPDNMNVTEVPS